MLTAATIRGLWTSPTNPYASAVRRLIGLLVITGRLIGLLVVTAGIIAAAATLSPTAHADDSVTNAATTAEP